MISALAASLCLSISSADFFASAISLRSASLACVPALAGTTPGLAFPKTRTGFAISEHAGLGELCSSVSAGSRPDAAGEKNLPCLTRCTIKRSLLQSTNCKSLLVSRLSWVKLYYNGNSKKITRP